jgi:hypothetical protein
VVTPFAEVTLAQDGDPVTGLFRNWIHSPSVSFPKLKVVKGELLAVQLDAVKFELVKKAKKKPPSVGGAEKSPRHGAEVTAQDC